MIACTNRRYYFCQALFLLTIPLQQHAARYSRELHPGEEFPEIQQELDQAIRENNTSVVEQIIKSGSIDVNAPLPSTFFTPLTAAVYLNLPDMVQTLLSLDADINRPSPMKVTPLTLAAGLPERLDMIRLLISEGAELNTRDQNQHTAIQTALKYNNLNNAKELFIRGAIIAPEDITQLPSNVQERAEAFLQDPEILKARTKIRKALKEHGMYDDLIRFTLRDMTGRE